MVTPEPGRPAIKARDWKDEVGWYPDPTGRYAMRSWKGSSWSDQVRPKDSLNSQSDELTSEQLAGLPSPHPDEDLTTGGPSAALLFRGLDASAVKDWDAKRERAAHIWS